MSIEIQLKRGTASYLDQRNPVLAAGEPCVETDTRRVKYGDGATPWRQLPYSGGAQTDEYFFAGQTTTETPLTLTGDRVITLNNDELIHFDVAVTGQQIARFTPTAVWTIRGSVCRRTDGSLAFVGAVTSSVSGAVTTGQTATVILNSAINGISIRVTGVANKTIKWSAQLTLKKLSMAPFAFTPSGGCADPDADNYDTTAFFDDNSCTYPGPPATTGIVLVETGVEEITGLEVTIGNNTLTPAFDPTIHDYYVRSSAAYGAAASYAVNVNDGEFTANGSTAAAYTLQITDGTNYYYVRVLPSDMQVGVINYGPESDYVPGYYLCVNASQQTFPNLYWIIMDHRGVPLWYARDGQRVGSLHLGGDVNRLAFSRDYTVRTVGRINAASLSVRQVDFLPSPTYGSSFGWDTHDTLELSAPVERRYNVMGISYINGFYLQEQSADGTLVWEWSTTDYFDTTDPEFFHTNSIDVHPVTGNVLVSSRHTNSIMCIDFNTKEVLWAIDSEGQLQAAVLPGKLTNTKWLTIEDEPAGYNGVYHAHDARWRPNIAPLTAGNDVISAYDNQTFTANVARGVIYEIDLVAGTATHRSSIFSDAQSPYICNYAVVEDGDVAGVYSHAVYNVLGLPGNASAMSAQVDEYRGTVDGAKTKVFALGMLNPSPLNNASVPNYRIIKVKPDNFRLDNLRAMCGVKIDGTWPVYTPPPPPPPPSAISTPVLLNFNGTNGSTTFTNTAPSNVTFTANGNAQLSTAQSKFGGSSALFDGNGDYLIANTATPFQDWGTEDWTVEMWLYPTSVSGYRPIFLSNGRLNIHIFGTGAIYINNAQTGAGGIATGNNVVVVNQWQHFAVSRKDGTTSLYVNGTRMTSSPVPYGTGSGTLHIGGDTAGSGAWYAGYIDDLRVTIGAALYDGGTITVPTSELELPPPPTSTVTATLLLNFNGSNNSTTFTNSAASGITVTANGDPKISTTQSKFGGASGLFDVDSYYDYNPDYLTLSSATPFQNWGTEDWTLEMWLYPTDVSGYRPIFLSNGRFNLHLFNNGDLYVNDATTGVGGIAAENVLIVNQWQHVAVSRKGSTTSLYVDGVRVASTAVPYGAGSGEVTIGGDGGSNRYVGYIDDLRFVKGTAVYDGATITVPTSELAPPPPTPTVTATLLLNFNGSNNSTTFTDSSSSALTVTASGNTKISTAQSKFGGASALFEGNGDFLTVSSSDAAAFGTGDFTVEAWLYFNNINEYSAIAVLENAWVFYVYKPAYGDATLYWGVPLVSNDLDAAVSFSTGQWYHVAATRASGTLRLFIDGQIVASDSIATAYGTDPAVVKVGTYVDNYLDGYVDDLRVVKGTAVYTANFTPPTAQLPPVG